ncbi:MAG TPA: amidohydrolase family protein [Candidatus Solibacter sp.]|nr:amidohydrolase family protein [Candidatus Solibacter sp.]
MKRRQCLQALGMTTAAGALPQFAAEAPPQGSTGSPLDLSQYQPRSMLHTGETKVGGPRYPVIDVHTHLSWTAKSQNGVSVAGERQFIWPAERVLQTMDRAHIRAMVNLTGGFGAGLEEAIAKFDRAHPGRFYTFTEPSYNRFLEPNYASLQADAIGQAQRAGARGLKILKTLGLYLRENIGTGKLVKIDDPRFDPMWDACGQLNLPVAIHISDPAAFFTPTDRFNERFEELNNHPDWSFHGRDFPSNAELLEARNRVLARHPKTQFVALHAGNFAEDLDNVSAALDRYPNMTVDIAARVGELGRQPRRARRFFDRYQDRILFGTDAVPDGHETPQQVFTDELYEIYYRFLETDDEYFDYAPAPVPPQGRWRIYGLQLPDGILHKVYNQNAARVLRISL